MAKVEITLNIPEYMLPVLADGFWQTGRPLGNDDQPVGDKAAVKRWML